MTIKNEVQKTETSEYIELWELDLTIFSDSIYYFTVNAKESGDVVWNGNTYTPMDIEANGFEWDGTRLPTPKLSFSLTNQVIRTFILSYGDMLGAKVTRTRTYRKFLDGEPTANPNEYFSKDVYIINQKTTENKFLVELELSSYLDQQNIEVPLRRTITFCPWKYRRYNGSGFDYIASDNACPYTGTNYFDENGTSTTIANDKCSRTVETGCKPRFGATAELPFGGFPGVSRPTI